MEPMSMEPDSKSNIEDGVSGASLSVDAEVVENENFVDETRGETESDTKDDEDDVQTYPADCYSLMSVNGPFDKTIFFYFGFTVWCFQILFLVYMVLNIIHPQLTTLENDDNPDNTFWAKIFATNTNSLTKATQFTALVTYCLFADESVKDVVTAIETFPNFRKVQRGDRVNLMVFSCFLRLTQGLVASFVVFLLVASTTQVIDIILNFTAVNFISGFDDIAFELAQWGKYGPGLKNEADRIEELPVPKCMYRKHQRLRYMCTIVPLMVCLLIFLCIVSSLQQSSGRWTTTTLRIQFKDDPLRNKYNGCYNEVGRLNKRVVFESFEANEAAAKFGYCINEKKWYMYEGDSLDACKIEEEDKLAFSAKTFTFDHSSVQEETWYSRTGTPLELYFFDEDRNVLDDEECSGFLGDGHCDQIFNIFDHSYDEGDCCAASCEGSKCGIGALTQIFGENITSGNGYVNCKDPSMTPITIKLTNVYPPKDNGLVDKDGAPDPFGHLPDRSPLFVLDCDDKNVMMINVNGTMKFQSETVMVADGAECKITVQNATGGPVPLQFVNYTVFHGNEESTDTDPIVIFNEDSSVNGIHSFQRIPECIFTKLKDHVDIKTIYTGNGASNKAIQWLVEDSQGYSSCEDVHFIERYALATMNFAAPRKDDADTEGLWITTERQCVWPTVVCVDGNVTELDLGAQTLSGTIATEIGLLEDLKWLEMSDNELIGTLPPQMTDWARMEYFGAHTNAIEGTIPVTLDKMTNLHWFIVHGNRLTGTIPSGIGEMSSLFAMVLSENSLTQSIPKEIAGASSMVFFFAGGNSFTGIIPTELGLMEVLVYLELSRNMLTGTIPTELGRLPKLKHLFLDDNMLTGSIPSAILNMELKEFTIYGNQLSNLIPIEGTEICNAGGGDLYCNCNSDCTFLPEQCECEAAKTCCSSFLEQFTECVVCPNDALQNPEYFDQAYQTTCSGLHFYIKNSLLEFGDDEKCDGGKLFFETLGCFCQGQ